jgi:hypothetical protein
VKKIKYYKINKIDSYNRIINFIVGARSIGKTYALKEKCIKQFKKNGYKFIYMRRYYEEIKSIKDKLFDDMKLILDENESIEVVGNEIFLTKKIKTDSGKEKKNSKKMGEFLWLAKSQTIKSASFIEYRTLIYDEFIIEDTIHHYFNNEVASSFMSIVSTIIRLSKNPAETCKFYLLANSVSKYNPYFDFFHITNLTNKKQFYTEFNKMVVLEYNTDTTFIEQANDTIISELIKGTEQEKYMIKNEFYLDDEISFIRNKINRDFLYTLTIRYKNINYGVFSDVRTIWITDKIDESFKEKYSVFKDDITPDYPIISDKFKMLISYFYKSGNVYYKNVKIRNAMRDCFQYI